VTYFDHNATTPLLPQARQAWLDASDQFIGNPSSPHRIGARAETALNSARQKLAAFLGCDSEQIVWTSGATESSNMVLHHLRCAAADADEIWVSSIEHPCVREPAAACFERTVRWIPVTREGIIDLDWVKDSLRRGSPRLIAVMAANNETGVLQPWKELLNLCRTRGISFFCDAAQWIGKLPAGDLGRCDWISGCAHKFGGPKGAGFLKCPSAPEFHPLLRGGKQEEARRPGTENVAGVLSMVAALEVREGALSRNEHHRNISLRDQFEREVLKRLPGATVLGGNSERLWNTSHLLLPKTDGQHRWVVKLDKLGFAVSTGSACSSGREEPSHVLSAMGLSADEASRVLRFSSGWETTSDDWKQLLEGLEKVADELKTN
jgi:cysteine desulfurase